MDLGDKIIETLQNDEKLMQKLVDILKFEKTKHSIHSKKRPCYKGDRGDQCDDCYSGDTEFEHKDDIQTFFKSLAKTIPFPYEKEGEEDEGEESEDDGCGSSD